MTFINIVLDWLIVM